MTDDRPPMTASEESTDEQLQLAVAQGEALQRARSELGTERQPFLWHPWLYDYGRNWTVPGRGTDGIRVQVAPPSFMRHDRENGRRYLEPAAVDFAGIEIEPAQKRA